MTTNELLLIIAIFGFVFALVRTAIAYRKWRYKRADRQDNTQPYNIARIAKAVREIKDLLREKL